MSLKKILNPWSALKEAEAKYAHLEGQYVNAFVLLAKAQKENLALRSKIQTACQRDPKTGRFRPMGE